jgi:hypothetical protein
VNTVMFSFCKRQGISWLNEQLLASEEGFCSMELVIEVPLSGLGPLTFPDL